MWRWLVPYGFLADLLVALHFAIVAFVVVGQVLILIGIPLGWRWIRNMWFRLGHLAAIGFIVTLAFKGASCPLTLWEQQLREAAGQDFYSKSFIGHWLQRVLYYDVDSAILDLCHIVFGLLVLFTFLVAPPRWRWRKRKPVEMAATPPQHQQSSAVGS
jgi:hypothetical protein